MEAIDDFDTEKVVAEYRKVIGQLESATTEVEKSGLRLVASQLRDQWTNWQGEDSLHEMAFGEPEDWTE